MSAIYGEAVPYVEGSVSLGGCTCFTPPYPYVSNLFASHGTFVDGASSGLLIKPDNFPNITDTGLPSNQWVEEVSFVYGHACGGEVVQQVAGQLSIAGDYKQAAETTINNRWFAKVQWVSLSTYTIVARFEYNDSTTTEGNTVVAPSHLDTWWCYVYDATPTLIYDGPSDPNAPFTITWDETAFTETVSWGNISTSLTPMGLGGSYPSVRQIKVAYNRANRDQAHIPGPDYTLPNTCDDVTVSISGLTSTNGGSGDCVDFVPEWTIIDNNFNVRSFNASVSGASVHMTNTLWDLGNAPILDYSGAQVELDNVFTETDAAVLLRVNFLEVGRRGDVRIMVSNNLAARFHGATLSPPAITNECAFGDSGIQSEILALRANTIPNSPTVANNYECFEYATGSYLLRIETSGAETRVRMWPEAETEPGTWTVTVTATTTYTLPVRIMFENFGKNDYAPGGILIESAVPTDVIVTLLQVNGSTIGTAPLVNYAHVFPPESTAGGITS